MSFCTILSFLQNFALFLAPFFCGLKKLLKIFFLLCVCVCIQNVFKGFFKFFFSLPPPPPRGGGGGGNYKPKTPLKQEAPYNRNPIKTSKITSQTTKKPH